MQFSFLSLSLSFLCSDGVQILHEEQTQPFAHELFHRLSESFVCLCLFLSRSDILQVSQGTGPHALPSKLLVSKLKLAHSSVSGGRAGVGAGSPGHLQIYQSGALFTTKDLLSL